MFSCSYDDLMVVLQLPPAVGLLRARSSALESVPFSAACVDLGIAPVNVAHLTTSLCHPRQMNLVAIQRGWVLHRSLQAIQRSSFSSSPAFSGVVGAMRKCSVTAVGLMIGPRDLLVISFFVMGLFTYMEAAFPFLDVSFSHIWSHGLHSRDVAERPSTKSLHIQHLDAAPV